MNCWELSDAHHIPKAAPESPGSQWVLSVWKGLLVRCKHVGSCIVDVLCVCVAYEGQACVIFIPQHCSSVYSRQQMWSDASTPSNVTQVADNVFFWGARCEFQKESGL